MEHLHQENSNTQLGNTKITRKTYFVLFFFVGLRVELRASHLESRHSTA
jgi:hypothetical protein